MEGMIEITGVDLKKFAQRVYELSNPKGWGLLHFSSGPLTDMELAGLVDVRPNRQCALRMDYVNGRACKMTVLDNGGKLFIRDTWYDHDNETFVKLLKEFNITPNVSERHGIDCECSDCRKKRSLLRNLIQ